VSETKPTELAKQASATCEDSQDSADPLNKLRGLFRAEDFASASLANEYDADDEDMYVTENQAAYRANARLAPLVAAIEELRDVAKLYSPEDWHDLGMLSDAASTVFVITDKLKEGK
jgi:hypothetical protein